MALDAAERDQDEDEAETSEVVMDVADVPRHDDRAAGDLQHPLARVEQELLAGGCDDAVERGVAEEALPLARCDLLDLRVDGQALTVEGARAVRQNLRDEILLVGIEALVVRVRVARMRGELGVHLRVELVTHDEIGRRAREGDYHRDDAGRDEREAGPKRHGSRST
jgi:hypothetical protein